MDVEEKGLTRREVLASLRRVLGDDLTYGSGRILGSMCTRPHALAREVYEMCLEKNLGDPGLFPGMVKVEAEAIRMLGSLLSNPGAHGHIVSGGSEANILAMWAARNLSGKERPEVVVPEYAHFSLDKAANLLNTRLVRVKLKGLLVDPQQVRRALSSSTAAIVGVAGTTDLGLVDPIQELSEIALENNIYLHVDAAFGGLVLPFLRELGHEVPDFDFRLPGVSSITVDPHKMGMAPIPAGGILFRDKEAMESITATVPYLAGGEAAHATITGTRPGASVAATWALLKHLGRGGYRRVVERCMNLTWMLAQGVEQMEGVRLTAKPLMNIVGITPMATTADNLAETLRMKRWAVGSFPSHVRIVVMPHLRAGHIRRFLRDLEKTVGGEA